MQLDWLSRKLQESVCPYSPSSGVTDAFCDAQVLRDSNSGLNARVTSTLPIIPPPSPMFIEPISASSHSYSLSKLPQLFYFILCV